MKIEVDIVKGFQDYLPPESLKLEEVKKIIENCYKMHGFVPIETPVVEFDELMRSDNMHEDEAVSDRFRLRDRAGRNLGLRYEFTFQLARIFKQNPNIIFPFKRYQIGHVFRDEPIGAGRYRQFIQCDADIIGDSSIKADTECLVLVNDILKSLNIKAEIQINNRKLLASIIESVEIRDVWEVMKELDKIEKIGEDIVKMNLKKYADSNKILTLFKLVQKDISFFRENKFDGAEELYSLQKECSINGVKTKFNPLMIRGLAYYTGNIFEVKQEGKSSIAAGGRYDNTVGKYLEKHIPAVGISFGLERLTEIANIAVPAQPKVIILSINQDKQSVQLAKKLRKAMISTDISYDKVGKSLEYANALKIPYVVFIGEEEIKKGKFKLRNMSSGEEKYLSEKRLITALS
ncbi:MAG: histidine--tRNA ligase [Nanoarchaeota archaeon]